jgi:hypothetical protein
MFNEVMTYLCMVHVSVTGAAYITAGAATGVAPAAPYLLFCLYGYLLQLFHLRSSLWQRDRQNAFLEAKCVPDFLKKRKICLTY